MILGIDAANIRAGGGVTHLVALLKAADPLASGFSKVVLWSVPATLRRIEERPWLEKRSLEAFDRSTFHRTYWQRFQLSRLARETGCDVLFVPGGSFAGDFSPVVAMHQNLLPFELGELFRYGFSVVTFKLLLLRWSQSRTFARAAGVIFLSHYGQERVEAVLGSSGFKRIIIPHGPGVPTTSPPREQLPITQYTFDRPFRLLYVSIVDVYKHQWVVARAVAELRAKGFPVALDLIGPAYPAALRLLKKTLRQIDPEGGFIRYLGPVDYQRIAQSYRDADLGVFASSCETFSLILTEMMACGLPIACSDRQPLPEVLGKGGEYFDPESADSVAGAIRVLLEDVEKRRQIIATTHQRVRELSWETTATQTFDFLASIARSGAS